MLIKIRYAMENNMNYYYPGYISPDYPKFDYKLFPGSEYAEVYDTTSEAWTKF
jgi:leucyl-tRNA---protein transferase